MRAVSRGAVFWGAVFLGAVVSFCSSSSLIRADDAETPGSVGVEVHQLLDRFGDAKSFEDQDAGDRHYRQRAETLDDWRYDYAQALVLIQQFRNREAAVLLAELIDKRPDDWRLRRAKAWTSLAARHYESALVDLDALVKSLPSPADEQDLPGREAAHDVGRMFGFLESAVESETTSAIRQRYLRRWNLQWTPLRSAAFEAGRAQVADEHKRLMGDSQTVAKDAAERAKRERDAKLAELEKQQADLTRRDDELQREATRLRDELANELAAVERLDRPLREQMGRLEASAVAIDRELALLSTDIVRLQRRLDLEPDPVIRARLEQEILRLDALAARQDAELLGLERQMDLLGLRRRELAVRGRSAQADLGARRARLDEQREDLEKLDRRLNSQRLRVVRSRVSPASGGRSLAAKAGVIATYLDFPLLEEKRRLLESLD